MGAIEEHRRQAQHRALGHPCDVGGLYEATDAPSRQRIVQLLGVAGRAIEAKRLLFADRGFGGRPVGLGVVHVERLCSPT